MNHKFDIAMIIKNNPKNTNTKSITGKLGTGSLIIFSVCFAQNIKNKGRKIQNVLAYIIF
ncbi:hypothetical protein CAPN002_19510 [Capnocytophaga stomatis]|nr:hypothetical protein CAPN002_19510 [Capnocytophaga stomatis]